MSSGAAMLQGAGSLLSAFGQLQSGLAEQKAAEQNALLAEQEASEAIKRAVQDERALRVQGKRALGDIQAGYAASGVTSEGSPLLVLKDSARAIEMDALNVRYEGASKAASLRNDAKITRYRGESARDSSRIGAAATLLSGAASVAAKSPNSPKRTN